MTCVIHHGPPGSYKSFGTIQRAVIPALVGKEVKNEAGEKELVGRTVVTNIRGLDSIERIEEALDVSLHPDSQIIFVDADDETGFQAMRFFFHWVPFGALIAMDETQRIFSKKRHRDLKFLDLKLTDGEGNRRDADIIKSESQYWDGDYNRPETVETAFDQHRHMNWDIYCTTPNISKVHPEIREVVEIAYRHRGLGALLPWWRNKWMEFTHDSETSGKSASHYLGSPKTYKADTRIFSCYQSTKTGKALGTSEARYIYNDPKFQMLSIGFLVAILAFIGMGVKVYQTSPFLNGFREPSIQEDIKTIPQTVDNDSRNDIGISDPASDLEAKFNDLAKPEVDDINQHQVGVFIGSTTKTVDITGLSTFIGSYHKQGFTVRLAAIVTMSDRLFYRIHVFDRDIQIDDISQSQIIKMGYQHSFDGDSLRIESRSESFMIRPYGSIETTGNSSGGRSYARTKEDSRSLNDAF
jgi:zona occludens toxin (predicted ATPase)